MRILILILVICLPRITDAQRNSEYLEIEYFNVTDGNYIYVCVNSDSCYTYNSWPAKDLGFTNQIDTTIICGELSTSIDSMANMSFCSGLIKTQEDLKYGVHGKESLRIIKYVGSFKLQEFNVVDAHGNQKFIFKDEYYIFVIFLYQIIDQMQRKLQESD